MDPWLALLTGRRMPDAAGGVSSAAVASATGISFTVDITADSIVSFAARSSPTKILLPTYTDAPDSTCLGW